MIKEIYFPLYKMIKDSINQISNICSDSQNLSNCDVLSSIQNSVITLGENLENDYCLKENPVIGGLEKVCETLYYLSLDNADITLLSDQLKEYLNEIPRLFTEHIFVTDYKKGLIITINSEVYNLTELIDSKINENYERFYIYDCTNINLLSLLQPYIAHNIVYYLKTDSFNDDSLNYMKKLSAQECYSTQIDTTACCNGTYLINTVKPSAYIESIRCTILNTSAIERYFSSFAIYNPKTVLDIGMFMKRAGLISASFGHISINNDIELNGIDVMPCTKVDIYNRIYKDISDISTFIRQIEINNINKHYDLILFIDMARLLSREDYDLIKNWCINHGEETIE